MGAKDFGSMVQQQFTKADNFGATFPMTASPDFGLRVSDRLHVLRECAEQ
jgi:hypothetical protein